MQDRQSREQEATKQLREQINRFNNGDHRTRKERENEAAKRVRQQIKDFQDD